MTSLENFFYNSETNDYRTRLTFYDSPYHPISICGKTLGQLLENRSRIIESKLEKGNNS